MKRLMLFTAALLLIISCGSKTRMVTVPFQADALGNYIYIGPDTLPNPKCVAPLDIWRAIVDGKGSGTPLGDFTMHFDFCGDSLSNYGNAYAYLVAGDKDTLFINCTGRVFDGRLDDHPSYVVSYWKDTIVILGGTGKYAGATGTIMTDDYNSSEDPNSHHHWTGTITMAKSKK